VHKIDSVNLIRRIRFDIIHSPLSVCPGIRHGRIASVEIGLLAKRYASDSTMGSGTVVVDSRRSDISRSMLVAKNGGSPRTPDVFLTVSYPTAE